MAKMIALFPPASPSININGNARIGGDYRHPSLDSFTVLHRYIPSNEFVSSDSDSQSDELDLLVDAFTCDHFRMYEFKVRRCARGRSHDWTECPYAHPCEKARRRDPRKYHYSGTPCPEFRKGSCDKGDSCEFAHGVFECWLHPARYRTQPCKDGLSCCRRVCFFAHTPEQLRVLPQQSPSADGSFTSSPTSILNSQTIFLSGDSPPMSPNNPQLGGTSFDSVNELAFSMRNLQVSKMKMNSPSWGFQMGSGFGASLPSTPSRTPTWMPTRPVESLFDLWDQCCDAQSIMERVESGKVLRAEMYAKLSKENSLNRVDSVDDTELKMDWMSELVN